MDPTSSTGLTRPGTYSNDMPNGKRRRLDGADEVFEVSRPSAPMAPVAPVAPGFSQSGTIPTQIIGQSQWAASSYITQPTQPLGQPQQQHVLQTPPRSTIQVPASSPLAQNSPNHPHATYTNGGYTNGTLPVYQQPPVAKPFNFSEEGPQYIASSDDDDFASQDIKPDFDKPSTHGYAPGFSQAPSNYGAQQRSYLPPSSGISRVPESPPVRHEFARFSYMPKGHTNSAPVAPVRLDSLKYRPKIGSFQPQQQVSYTPRADLQMAGRPVALGNGATVDDITPGHFPERLRPGLAKMKVAFPQAKYLDLAPYLENCSNNVDSAIRQFSHQKGIPPSGPVNAYIQQQQPPQQASQQLHWLQPNPPPAKTSKKDARVPRRTIKDKYFGAQDVSPKRKAKSPPPVERRSPRPQRRRLVRKSAREPTPISDMEESAEDSEASDSGEEGGSRYGMAMTMKVLDFINTCQARDLTDTTGCKEDIAQAIIDARPFSDLDEARNVTVAPVVKTKRGAQRRPAGDKVVDECLEAWRGYEAVDALITRCHTISKPITESIKAWGVNVSNNDNETGELDILEVKPEARDSAIGSPSDGSDNGPSKDPSNVGNYFKTQPSNLRKGVELKDYQLVGINWLNLLYSKNLSCILADEMGLGKTCQVISFMAHLLEFGISGPHLVVVPASTLENWLREFANFCPSLVVRPYYGSQKERATIRQELYDEPNYNVLVTTYNLANGDKYDKKFLKERKFDVVVYDEGHMLKNSNSSRYMGLMQLPAQFRLLLTGTPLQNNLQELASLLSFILPGVFIEKKDDLAVLFKHKAKTTDEGDSASNALLSGQRVRRAKAMMTPFVLRRKKEQVLKHLPSKTSRVEYSKMTKSQQEIYMDQIKAAQDAIQARAEGKKGTKSTSNLMMQLRKAAIHPWLFRRHFSDKIIEKMSKDIMKEPVYQNNNQKFILEDMTVMNDFELNRLCRTFPNTLGKYQLKSNEHMDAGKVKVLKKLLVDMKANGDRILVFSQFTQVLDILEEVLTTLDMTFVRIDGQTAVETRQDVIDQFHEEEDITVFLLSTKAGGFGINLACANKVVIFDSSFNPHDDRQAADRAHRVGQTRPVEVVTLVMKGTIEEQILALANTKLALDQSLSEESAAADSAEKKGEELVAKMLLGQGGTSAEPPLEEEEVEKEETKDEASKEGEQKEEVKEEGEKKEEVKDEEMEEAETKEEEMKEEDESKDEADEPKEDEKNDTAEAKTVEKDDAESKEEEKSENTE